MKTDKVDDKSGGTKYYTKVVALSMQMLTANRRKSRFQQ